MNCCIYTLAVSSPLRRAIVSLQLFHASKPCVFPSWLVKLNVHKCRLCNDLPPERNGLRRHCISSSSLRFLSLCWELATAIGAYFSSSICDRCSELVAILRASCILLHSLGSVVFRLYACEIEIFDNQFTMCRFAAWLLIFRLKFLFIDNYFLFLPHLARYASASSPYDTHWVFYFPKLPFVRHRITVRVF